MNDYATKMLLLFYPFRENHDLPLFEDRWKFFCEAHERGSLYWDSTRIMQNIQDVQYSKKIVSKQESLEVLSGVDSILIDSNALELKTKENCQITWESR